jgi:hypothetical protein
MSARGLLLSFLFLAASVAALPSDGASAATQGFAWSKRSPATSPPGTAYAEMTNDAEREQVVMFGGTAGGTYSGATWTWDGDNWTERTSPTKQQTIELGRSHGPS